ncbi:translation factor waclaw [Rhodnius prolixus]
MAGVQKIILNTLLRSNNCPRLRSVFAKSKSRFFGTTAKPSDVNSKVEADSKVWESIPVENVRNFSIVAHVDHGKSTLADRLLEITGYLTASEGNQQVLDRLQVEKERGITVKAQTASLIYELNGKKYLLNLIDTPGHVDFSNEVARSLSTCQGVILLVDANQGVQAQTVANFYLAFTQDLAIIPVLNKVDLKNAEPELVAQQLNTLFSINTDEILKISAKFGNGVPEVIKAIINRIPAPPSDRGKKLQALLFDSWYDRYRGAIGMIYVKNGEIKVGDEVMWCHTGKQYTVKGLSVLTPEEIPVNILKGGQVGCVICNMRSSQEAHVGDTLVHSKDAAEPLPGFKPNKPMVFAGIYPFNQAQHTVLRAAIEKLTLNDNAVSVTIDSSPALGQGWRLGFLGLLHLEVFNQRLEQEYDAQAIVTAASVTYKVRVHGRKSISQYGREELFISNPAHFPENEVIAEISEPIVLGTIITPDTYLGDIISLCMEKRGVQQSAVNIDNTRVMIQFELPLNEIILDFHDRLKSVSSGYASFDYEDRGYVASNLVKLHILLNGVDVEELRTIVHSSKARIYGKRLCSKLVNIIPRQQFHIAIQAKVGGKIIARENIKPYRKDVTAKLYGGDVTRRMKLLKKQAEGKKHLKSIANISLPRETFIEVLKR